MYRHFLALLTLALIAIACGTPTTATTSNENAGTVAPVQTFEFEHVVQQPQTKVEGQPSPVLILMHGYGSNEQDLVSIAKYLDDRLLIVSARAPHEIRANGYAWYNLTWENGTVTGYDEAQAEASLNKLSAYIDQVCEAFDGDPERVYLGGFSQGAIMSADYVIRDPERVAGIIAMSGRLRQGEAAEPLPAALNNISVMITHGTNDKVIPVEEGRDMAKTFRALTPDVTYEEYDMAHTISAECVGDVRTWLTAQLNQ